MTSYPHMCRDGHEEIGHADSGDDERCRLCRALDSLAAARKLLAEAAAYMSGDPTVPVHPHLVRRCREAGEAR